MANIESHLIGYDQREVEIRSKLYAELREQARNAGIAIEALVLFPGVG